MKIAFVTYGEKSMELIPKLLNQNWLCINVLATEREKQIDTTVWSTLLNSKLDIDMLVIITDGYVPYNTMRWAEFCSMHGIKFRLNEGTVKWNLDPYCDYGIEQPKDQKLSKNITISHVQIQIDPKILRFMKKSRQWGELLSYYNSYYKALREKRELNEVRQRDYKASRLIYDFVTADWKTIKRHARLFCLPTVILEMYKLLESDEQHDILHNNLVPEFTGYSEFFRACWNTRNWFITEVLRSAQYVSTGFSNLVELEQFNLFWRPVYDISPSLTDIEAATSISYFLLMGIAPELRDIHLQLIPKESLSR